jgi:hypothetical protein
MATNYQTVHLNVPLAVYKKLQDQAKEERRPVSNLALVLIEKGLEAK